MTQLPRRALVVAMLATSLVAVACTDLSPSTTASIPSPTATPATTSAPTTTSPSPTPVASGPLALDSLSITTEPFARIIGSPLSMTAPDDGTDRIFVANQVGQVWVVSKDGQVAKDLMVNLDDRILSGGEQGLLGIATHPDFASDPRVFVDFTNNDGDTIVASLEVDPANPDRLDPSTFQQLLFVDQPYPNHNGGAVVFGKDGYLYIAFGDGGSGGDPHGNGQNPDTLLGKILRIDVDHTSAERQYAIPPENPFATSGGKPEIWLLGMRNPWRISFDRQTGDLWIGDVGQGLWEEVDVLRAGSPGGLNFGWNITEGAHCYGAKTCKETGLTKPVAEYGHELGCAITGGYVYRGSKYPLLVGTYLFSDNCSGRIFAIDATSDGPSVPVEVGQGGGSVAGFGEDSAGELYILTLEGSVSRVVAALR